MWPDNETTIDLLGFRVHADLIRSVVTNANLLPVTIGIFGDWGSGKTSVMRMLQHDLDSDNYQEGSADKVIYEKVVCLYFNGWLFEGYDDAKSALLSSVLLQLAEHRRFGDRIKTQVASLMESVDWMRLAKFGLKEVALPVAVAYLSGGISMLPTIAASINSILGVLKKNGEEQAAEEIEGLLNWEKFLKTGNRPTDPMDVRTFRDRFSKMLKTTDIQSLIVMIDDLDRCSPGRIVENLEAIKLFLSVERTAFVIGADPRIIRHAISTMYEPARMKIEGGDQDMQTDIVEDYIEKVIQVPYHLPWLSPAEVETYMSLLFCHRCLEEKAFNELHRTWETRRERDRYSVFGYGEISASLGTIPNDLSNDLTFCARTAPLITEGLKGNPRQVKRFLNAFILRKQLADVAKLENIQDNVLVKLMVLEYADPKRFKQLYKWQSSQGGFPKELLDLEKVLCPPNGSVENEEEAKEVNPDWATSFIRRWIVMEPYLSSVDLRDYFWVARDKLYSTMSDVSMVPPFVRRTLEALVSGNTGQHKQALTSMKEFRADEITILLNLLVGHIMRNPGEKNGFDGLRALVEGGIPGSANALSEALVTPPADQIPPAVGMDILTLIKAKPELMDKFDQVLIKLSGTDTKVGRAIRPPLQKR